jgi:hypothetical protein
MHILQYCYMKLLFLIVMIVCAVHMRQSADLNP